MSSILPPILDQAHDWVRGVLVPGDLAIDATVGNGNDTAFLAQRVGTSGQVIGFDVQQSALDEAARRLRDAGLSERVVLLHRGHEEIKDAIEAMGLPARPKVVMFNLGYRPGGDHSVITRPETTVAALDQVLDLVLPGGLITIVVYSRHAGGQAEADAVLAWAHLVPAQSARAVRLDFLDTASPAPFLIALAIAQPPWPGEQAPG